MHLVEHSSRFKARIVETFLALLDVLELDAMLLIGSLEQGRADREFRKLPMEHHNTLLEREVGPRLESIRVKQEPKMSLTEL